MPAVSCSLRMLGLRFHRVWFTDGFIGMTWSYERFELEDVTLYKTADFDCSRSGNLRTVFGAGLRLLFAVGSAVRCRVQKHDPVPDLLTSRAFVGIDPSDDE